MSRSRDTLPVEPLDDVLSSTPFGPLVESFVSLLADDETGAVSQCRRTRTEDALLDKPVEPGD